MKKVIRCVYATSNGKRCRGKVKGLTVIYAQGVRIQLPSCQKHLEINRKLGREIIRYKV